MISPIVENINDQEDKLFKVLDRQIELKSLIALIRAIQPQEDQIPLTDTAIALDANVFLRLPGHQKSEDIVDYLRSVHNAPLILPGQVIQEFWNNQLNAVQTVGSKLEKSLDNLRKDFEKIDSNFEKFRTDLLSILDNFKKEHGQVYEEATVQKTIGMLNLLQEKAKVPYVSRIKFSKIASHRKLTKTPPGFKDEGDGDFFVWIDMLAGLQQAKLNGSKFSKAVFISNDKKPDWTRGGVAHPILVAEVCALVNVPFEIWSIDQLAENISSST